MKVVCVGHSTFDTTLPVDEYPKENVKTRIKEHIECGGGPAANGAYLLAKWGMDTTIASVMGNDFYGQCVYEDFKKIGANTKYLELREARREFPSFKVVVRANNKNKKDNAGKKKEKYKKHVKESTA